MGGSGMCLSSNIVAYRSKTDSVARICDVRFTLEGRRSVSASLGIVCPGQISAAPGEAATERRQDQPVTGLEAMFIVPQAERDRRRRRVAEFMDGDHHALGRKLHALSRCLDDAPVGLMRH